MLTQIAATGMRYLLYFLRSQSFMASLVQLSFYHLLSIPVIELRLF